MICNNSQFIIGDTVRCNCSSDLEPTSISWFKGDQDTPFCLPTIYRNSSSPSLFSVSEALIKVAIEDHGLSYRCVSDTPYGTQEKSVEVLVEGTLLCMCNFEIISCVIFNVVVYFKLIWLLILCL